MVKLIIRSSIKGSSIHSRWSATRGRAFSLTPNRRRSPGWPIDRGVVVITESVARAFWPGQPAVGQSLWIPGVDSAASREVVGVVEDLQFNAIGEAPALHVFTPRWQGPSGVSRLLVKTAGDSTAMLDTVRRVLEQISPGTRIGEIAPLDALLSRATAQPRFTMRTVAAFGVVALILAAIGIYGTLSYVVGARTREIAIRLSLGASRSAVLPEVLRRSLLPVVGGGLIGILLAAALARTFEALLFQHCLVAPDACALTCAT